MPPLRKLFHGDTIQNTNLSYGQEVEVLHLSIPYSGLEIQRKLQIEDKLTFCKHPLFIVVGVARKYILDVSYGI